jgi:cytosine/adenosine deaminase-related metal-dependent hydrolase
VYLRDTDIAFTDDRISHVNRPHQGEADTKIDGHDHIAMPGLINIHSHPSSERSRKGITDEIRSLGFFHSSLYEFLTIFNNAPEGFAANVRVAMGKLLLSRVTTVVDISPPFDAWLGILAGSGIRACAAPGFRDAHWSSANSHQLSYEWDEANGRVGFERAQRVVDLANQHPSGRLMGMICPSQIDTSDISGAGRSEGSFNEAGARASPLADFRCRRPGDPRRLRRRRAQVVTDGKVMTTDMENALEALQEAQARSMSSIHDVDWAGRTAEELSLMVF